MLCCGCLETLLLSAPYSTFRDARVRLLSICAAKTFPLIGHFDTYLREIVSSKCSLRVTGDCLPSSPVSRSATSQLTSLPPHILQTHPIIFTHPPRRACKLHLTVCMCLQNESYLFSIEICSNAKI